MGINGIKKKMDKFFENPFRVFYNFNHLKISKILSDKAFLKLVFRARVGYKLNLKNPTTFNEKLQWLKLHDRNPIYAKLADKYDVREHIENKIGAEHLIPIIGVWENFDDIDFNTMPQQFVLKCTHDSGSVFVCEDKNKFDIDDTRRKINKALKNNFYYRGREWAYKDIKPRIIAEQYLSDLSEGGIADYKVFCFDGKPEFILVCKDRFGAKGLTKDFYDTNWKWLDFMKPPYGVHADKPDEAPQLLAEMLRLSETLSEGIPFVRADFYIVKDKIYFGELTFYPGNGFDAFEPSSWDKKYGELIDLSKWK